MKPYLAAALGLALSLAGGQAAFAHAKLVVARVAPQKLDLTFNEVISGKLSGATVKGADGKPIAATAMASGKGLMLTPAVPLKPGAYTVDWHAVASDDGHKTVGTYKFTVK